METKELTCIECPMGCSISVKNDNRKIIETKGNGCPRGKMYAEQEVICPMRVLITTVRHINGTYRIGDCIYKDFIDGANLIASGNIE